MNQLVSELVGLLFLSFWIWFVFAAYFSNKTAAKITGAVVALILFWHFTSWKIFLSTLIAVIVILCCISGYFVIQLISSCNQEDEDEKDDQEGLLGEMTEEEMAKIATETTIQLLQ